MKKYQLFFLLIIFIATGCATPTGNFQTMFDTDLVTATKHVESNLSDNNMKITKSRKGRTNVLIKAQNEKLELEIKLMKSGHKKEKVKAAFNATSRSAFTDPYPPLKSIVDDVKLRIEEEIDMEPEDLQPPKIIISSHRGLQIIEKSEKTTIVGKVTDNEKISDAFINNHRLTLDQYGNFTKEVTLSRGNNTFKITATDVNRNKSYKELIIVRKEDQKFPDPLAVTSIGEIPNWYTKQYALVIGIDRYKNPNIPTLRNAVNDAKALADMFRGMNFTVFELYNGEATRQSIMDKLKSIYEIIGPNDSFLLYFAGHGQGLNLQTGKRTGYIIPYDADIDLTSNNVLDYEDDTIALDTMKKITETMSSKHVALVLDSCFSGLVMKRSIPRLSALTLEHYIDFLNIKTINILTAGDDQPVSDGSGHSPFTMAILDAVKNKNVDVYDRDGYVTFDELYAYVKEKVQKATNNRQTPQFDNIVGGNGSFILKIR